MSRKWFTSKTLILIAIVTVAPISLAFAMVPRSTNGLSLKMILSKLTFQIGEPIDAVLKLTNMGNENVSLHFSDSHTHDIYLYSGSMKLITYLSKDCLFLQVLTSIRLEPGETKVWNISWTTLWKYTEIASGVYYLQGQVLWPGVPKTPFCQILILPHMSLPS